MEGLLENKERLPEIKELLRKLRKPEIADEIEAILSEIEGKQNIDEIKAEQSSTSIDNNTFELDSEMTEEFVSEFFEEAQRHIEEIENLLLEIEETFSTEKLKEVMRHFHTIKGDSSLVMNMVPTGARREQLELIHKLSHALEDIFQQAQHEDPSYTRDRLDSIFQVLGSMKAVIQQSEEISVLKSLLEKVRMLSDSSKTTIRPKTALQNILEQFLELSRDSSLEPRYLQRLALNVKKSLKRAGENEISKLVDNIMESLEKKDLKRVEEDIQIFERWLGKRKSIAETPPIKTKSGAQEKFIRIERDKLDALLNEVSELSNLVFALEQTEEPSVRKNLVGQLRKLSSRLSKAVISTRAIRVNELFNKFKLTVRDFARKQSKKVRLHIEETDVEIDRDIADSLIPLLTHLLRNAIDHGIESSEERKRAGKTENGNIFLRAEYKGGFIFIDVEDDGRGISVPFVKEKLVKNKLITAEQAERLSEHEILNYLFSPGFSTSEEVSEVSGRGVGLDVVKKTVEDMGGKVFLNTEPGKGTKFTMVIPLSLSIVKCILFKVSGRKYAIKSDEVMRTLTFSSSQIIDYGDYSLLKIGNKGIPLLYLSELLEDNKTRPDVDSSVPAFVLLDKNGEEIALAVDSIISEGEFLIKHLSGLLQGLFSGVISLGKDELALLIDLNALVDMV